jgi:hypothetical protein
MVIACLCDRLGSQAGRASADTVRLFPLERDETVGAIGFQFARVGERNSLACKRFCQCLY